MGTKMSKEIKADKKVQLLLQKVADRVRDELEDPLRIKDIGSMTALKYKFITFTRPRPPKGTVKQTDFSMGTHYFIKIKVKIGKEKKAKDTIFHIRVFEANLKKIKSVLIKEVQLAGFETKQNGENIVPYPRTVNDPIANFGMFRYWLMYQSADPMGIVNEIY